MKRYLTVCMCDSGIEVFVGSVATNRKAFYEYEILDRYEAGLVLTGDEVKSLRKGSVNLRDSFAVVKDGELMLLNCYIAPYSHAYTKEDASRRSRKLLLHKREIDHLIGEVSRKGYTLIPLKIYFNKRNKAKVEIGVAKHKKMASRKREIKERELAREASREVKVRIK